MSMTFWIHEVSQSALAAAVATLGVVILLELRSIVRLRRAMDTHLARVFEQLDLLRTENRPSTAPASEPQAAPPAAVAYSPPIGGGEARLMASLAAARARQGRTAA